MELIKSVDEEKLTNFLLDVMRLESHMDHQESKNLNLKLSFAKWNVANTRTEERRVQLLVNADLPWWLYFRNPYWMLLFRYALVRALKQQGGISTERLPSLENLLIRAEFIRPISTTTQYQIRRVIASKKISHWKALSLLTSYACNVTEAGSITPAGTSRFGTSTGVLIATVMVMAFVLLGATLIDELGRDCMRGCIVIAACQLMPLALGLVCISRELTWERSRKAKVLARVF